MCLPAVEEENSEYWRSQARETLQSVLDRKPNTNVAKNILFFLGDGKLRKALPGRTVETNRNYHLTCFLIYVWASHHIHQCAKREYEDVAKHSNTVICELN